MDETSGRTRFESPLIFYTLMPMSAILRQNIEYNCSICNSEDIKPHTYGWPQLYASDQLVLQVVQAYRQNIGGKFGLDTVCVMIWLQQLCGLNKITSINISAILVLLLQLYSELLKICFFAFRQVPKTSRNSTQCNSKHKRANDTTNVERLDIIIMWFWGSPLKY